MIKPIVIDVEAVTEWWRLAATSLNQQIKDVCEKQEKEVLEFTEHLVDNLDQIMEGAPEDIDVDEAKEALRKMIMSDPGKVVLSKMFAEILKSFMSRFGDDDFMTGPGKTISVRPVTCDGRIVGCEVEHSVDEDAVKRDVDNGISDIEEFLKAHIPVANSTEEENEGEDN